MELLTVTRSSLAAWTRMAICTSMENGLFQKVNVTAAYATMEKFESAEGSEGSSAKWNDEKYWKF